MEERASLQGITPARAQQTTLPRIVNWPSVLISVDVPTEVNVYPPITVPALLDGKEPTALPQSAPSAVTTEYAVVPMPANVILVGQERNAMKQRTSAPEPTSLATIEPHVSTRLPPPEDTTALHAPLHTPQDLHT